MRDGEHVRAGPRLEVLHVGPEVLGVLAVVLREGQRLVCDAGVAAEEHVAVQVVAADRGPLEADDRREGAGVVVAVGERGVGLPGVADRRLALDRRHVAGQRADDLHRRGEDGVVIAAGQLRVPALSGLGGEHLGVAAEELRHQAVHLGVVRDHQEVERPRQLGAQAAGRGDLLAAGEAEGVLLPEPVHRAGIDRDRGVQVGVAEQRPGRKAAPGIGRELRLDHPRDIGGRRRLVVADILRRSCGRDQAGSNERRGSNEPSHRRSSPEVALAEIAAVVPV